MARDVRPDFANSSNAYVVGGLYDERRSQRKGERKNVPAVVVGK